MSNYIKKIQIALRDAGHYFGLVDGDAGPKTYQAVLDAIQAKPTKVGDEQHEKASGYLLSQASLNKLDKVHPDLQKVVKHAIRITDVDFRVGEGLRTRKRQRHLLNQGATRTMNSRHLTGHAVDLIALDENGQVSWDWPLYRKIYQAMKKAAKKEGVSITWGGLWRTLRDGPHYQLSWKKYPK